MTLSKKITASISVIILRVLASLLIYIQPLLGIMIYVLFDSYDTLLLEDIGGMTYMEYERLDKIVDSATFLILLPLGLKYGNFAVLVALLIFRLVGTLIFYVKKKEYYLILFPNFFVSYLFLTIVLKEIVSEPVGKSLYFVAMILLVFFQLSLEILYHYVYPHYLRQGLLRKILGLLGYNSKRRI